MAMNFKSSSYILRHENYSTPGTGSPATKGTNTASFGASSSALAMSYILINNIDSANDASLSFDGGNTFLTLKHGTALELYVAQLYSYIVQDASNGSHASLQCLYGSELQ